LNNSNYFLSVKGNILLYKNHIEFQLTFKVIVKKGTNRIKSKLESIDFKYDRILFQIKK
jgi:hypothetical protein